MRAENRSHFSSSRSSHGGTGRRAVCEAIWRMRQNVAEREAALYSVSQGLIVGRKLDEPPTPPSHRPADSGPGPRAGAIC
jgi:hypothetical protein